MNFRFISFLFVIISIQTMGQVRSHNLSLLNVEASSLNGRINGPKTKVICSYPKGSQLEAVGFRAFGGKVWYQVIDPTNSHCAGKESWVFGKYVSPESGSLEDMSISFEAKIDDDEVLPEFPVDSETVCDSSEKPYEVLSTPICECEDCWFSSDYGPRQINGAYDFHHGHDYPAHEGETPVYSMSPGTVVRINSGCKVGDWSCGTGKGNYVLVRVAKPLLTVQALPNGKSSEILYGSTKKYTYVWYMHLHSISNTLRIGKKVKRGDVLALVGNTGFSTGPHLDIKITKKPNYRKTKYGKSRTKDTLNAYDPQIFFDTFAETISNNLVNQCPRCYKKTNNFIPL